VGIGGAEFLANYVDKKVFKRPRRWPPARAQVRTSADKLSHAHPTEALGIARRMAQ
jgi:hypothetical protein